ncbi:MAG: acetyl-CoA carboxylase biotin carboxyl carrier protein subunit [Thermoplasmata archaeon]|nr:acetyl-CoA carboxylase biotin carboxyl carrier protein subunit [Thermoplasmata archaeon]
MKVSLTIDGRPQEVEVDLANGTVGLLGREYTVVRRDAPGDDTELEVNGERVVVSGWPAASPSPEAPVTVNGERYRVVVGARVEQARSPPTAIAASRPAPPADGAAPAPGGATPLYPPMPGKVIELRVAEGEVVQRGQVVLVLEAMKMRNEVTSPAAGKVVGLKVSAGQNVRAREIMLSVAPN